MKAVGNYVHHCFTNATSPCLRLPPFNSCACKHPWDFPSVVPQNNRELEKVWALWFGGEMHAALFKENSISMSFLKMLTCIFLHFYLLLWSYILILFSLFIWVPCLLLIQVNTFLFHSDFKQFLPHIFLDIIVIFCKYE